APPREPTGGGKAPHWLRSLPGHYVPAPRLGPRHSAAPLPPTLGSTAHPAHTPRQPADPAHRSSAGAPDPGKRSLTRDPAATDQASAAGRSAALRSARR